MKATEAKVLQNLGGTLPNNQCFIEVGGVTKAGGIQGIVYMNTLPDISDSKSASYADESAIGRTMPFKTYQYSENRTISWTAHFVVNQKSDIDTIFGYLRLLESCVYPESPSDNGAPYRPPPICSLRCGGLLSGSGANRSGGGTGLFAVMKSYSVKFDTSVPWDQETFMPFKLDVDMQFDVVYNQTELPGSSQILSDGPGSGYGNSPLFSDGDFGPGGI